MTRAGSLRGLIRAGSCSNAVCDPDDVNHFSDLVNAHDVSPAQYAGRDGRSRAPFAFGWRFLPDGGGQK